MFNKQQINEIESKLGYNFKNKELLNLAFTHSSYGNLNAEKSNERLEFLGDSVLHLSTTKYLYEKFDLAEGILSKIRSYVVSTKNLSQAVKQMQIIGFLKYAKNNTKNTSASIQANLFEAILASIYLDAGFDEAYQFVMQKLHYSTSLVNELISNTKDYKTQLQEVTQVSPKNVLEYNLIKKDGPPHEPIFSVEVLLNKKVLGKGKGGSKKEAENIAAQNALKKLL
ncbi:MAG: ribonuclease III [Clostridia bacterium]|nr:ribonuclease III [Clostridia bacterium]